MVDIMEHRYPLHGHTRSMSSLASTIIPLRSDASPLTTFATSPVETKDVMDIMDLPIELRIPLPASSTCSGDEQDHSGLVETDPHMAEGAAVINEVQESQEVPIQLTETPQDGNLDKDISGTPGVELPAISLDELAQLIRLERYKSGHAVSVQNSLSRAVLSCGLNRRLIRSMALAYAFMVDKFKAEDQASFAGFFGACEHLVEGCDKLGRSTPTGPRFWHDDSTYVDPQGGPPSSWLQDLAPTQQGDILNFITKLRTDPNFLPDRISILSSAELNALSYPYQSTAPVESVLVNQSRGKARDHDKTRRQGMDSSSLDALREFHHKDPMFALLYDIFDDSSQPGSSEYLRRIDIWSTTCARTTTLGKRGSDEFLTVTLNSFASLQEWPLKHKLELFLIRILQEGAFLLDSSTNELMDFIQPLEIRKANAAIAGSNFFDKALKDLFTLLTEGSARDSIPGSVLDFARIFLNKIKDPRIRLRAKNFIAAKWYFSSFLSNILVHPESQGLMMTHHVGATARRTILKEMVIRMQKQVIDITSPWRNTLLVASDIQMCIGQFFQYFESSDNANSVRPASVAKEYSTANTFRAPLMISPHCITTLVKALFPESPPSPSSTTSVYNGADSAESSVAGSSTLTAGSTEPGCGTRSSSAPSISGTSMTSTTMLSDGPFVDSYVEDGESLRARKNDGTLCSKLGLAKAQEDLGLQLRILCEKLHERKELQLNSNKSHSADAWAFLYISDDGEKLSLTPFEANAAEKSLAVSEEYNDQWSNHQTKDYGFLSNAIIRLITNQDMANELFDILSDSETLSPGFDVLNLPIGAAFHAAMTSCQSRYDFNNAHFWFRSLEVLRQYTSTETPLEAYENLLRLIGRDVRTNMICHVRASERDEKWLRSLGSIQIQQYKTLQALKAERKSLRLKVWYVTDVRHSSTYEDALHVTRALRAMASPKRLKQPGSIANWARHRLHKSTPHARSEAQALEALSAPTDYGGPSKLADDQAELTLRWLTRNSVENFCKGEERIHRFCFEVQKCANKLSGASLLDSPVLWSSRLFERERLAFDRNEMTRLEDVGPNSTTNSWSRDSLPPSPGYGPTSFPTTFQNLRTNDITNNISRLWNTPRIAPNEPTHPNYLGFSWVQEPQETLPTGSFWPDNLSAVPLTATQPNRILDGPRVGRNATGEDGKSKKKAFTKQIKQNLNSLLLSDLGYMLWAQGSETDVWVNLDLRNSPPTPVILSPSQPQPDDGSARNEDRSEPSLLNLSVLLGKATSRVFSLPRQSSPDNGRSSGEPPIIHKHPGSDPCDSNVESVFPFMEGYKRLLQKFSTSPDPHVKLQMIYELEMLVLNSIQHYPSPEGAQASTLAQLNHHPSIQNRISSRTIKVPRTKATSLEEVTANCFERRAGTLKSLSSKLIPSPQSARFYQNEANIADTDEIVNTLLTIFRDSNLRPKTLFRDLQLIAAFVPSEILDHTPKGKAFWDAGLAGLALKEDLCETMIDRANQITTYHISGKKISKEDSSTTQNLDYTTLKDAAELWLITAKEGSATAARELGLFYLTHPELLPRVTIPFSKSKDVFRLVMSNDRGGNESGALDPLTFAVVFHWMELAANGGDKDAKDFLKGNGELSAVM